jgi:hypothetical protein
MLRKSLISFETPTFEAVIVCSPHRTGSPVLSKLLGELQLSKALILRLLRQHSVEFHDAAGE